MAAKFQNKTSTILGAIEEARSTAEDLRDEIQDWYDNLPQQFQDGDKGQELQDAIDALEEGITSLEDAESSDVQILLDYEISYTSKIWPKSTYWSRARRLEVGIEALQGVPIELPEGLTIPEDDQSEAEELLSTVQTAIDSLQSVVFPAMR